VRLFLLPAIAFAPQSLKGRKPFPLQLLNIRWASTSKPSNRLYLYVRCALLLPYSSCRRKSLPSYWRYPHFSPGTENAVHTDQPHTHCNTKRLHSNRPKPELATRERASAQVARLMTLNIFNDGYKNQDTKLHRR